MIAPNFPIKTVVNSQETWMSLISEVKTTNPAIVAYFGIGDELDYLVDVKDTVDAGKYELKGYYATGDRSNQDSIKFHSVVV
ncbi:MAG: hypothetical protein LBV22_03140, partial [Mycoplasmataceae bacterium]|nr:hypothetical protein [Mycoplasmataceae bacterium]